MSEILTVEERLRRFAAAVDDADWQDVLRRADLSMSRRDTAPRRPRLTRRRLVAAVVVVIALAAAAVAIAGHSLFGVSNHGKRTYPGVYALHELHWHAGIWAKIGLHIDTAKPGTFVQLALRQGIGVYAARSKKDNSLCYYTGQRQSIAGEPPNRLYLDGPGCGPFGGNFALPERIERISIGGRKAQAKGDAWLRTHPFPSPARPVLDMSGEGNPAGGGMQFIGPLVGVVANSIRSIQLLAQSDCHPVVTVPVIDNVYIDARPPKVAEAFLVARDAGGRVVWHSWPLNPGPYLRTPLDRMLPRNCGLG